MLSEPVLLSTQVLSIAPLGPPIKTHICTNAASNAIHSRAPSPFGCSDVDLNSQSAPKAAGSGYYGSTSYYSVFDQVGHVPTATTHCQPSGPAGDTLSAAIRDDDPVVSRSLQLGSEPPNLQHVSIIQSLAGIYVRTSQVSSTVTSIPLEAVETLQHLASGEMHAPALKITRNTQRLLQVPPEMYASTFSTLFTSENLR